MFERNKLGRAKMNNRREGWRAAETISQFRITGFYNINDIIYVEMVFFFSLLCAFSLHFCFSSTINSLATITIITVNVIAFKWMILCNALTRFVYLYFLFLKSKIGTPMNIYVRMKRTSSLYKVYCSCRWQNYQEFDVKLHTIFHLWFYCFSHIKFVVDIECCSLEWNVIRCIRIWFVLFKRQIFILFINFTLFFF